MTTQKILEEYENGLSINQICEKYKLSYTFVRYRIYKANKIRKRHYIREPQLNQKYGMLTYKESFSTRGDKKKWRMLCDCGNYKEAYPYLIKNNIIKSCGCSTYKLAGQSNFKGYEDISLTYFHQIENGAKSRSLDFNITIEFIWELFLKQNKKCILTGLPLIMKNQYRKCVQTASLDRIDPYKGYTKDNVQWIHKVVNSCKFMLNNEQFFTMCKLVYEKNKEYFKEDLTFINIKYINRILGDNRK